MNLQEFYDYKNQLIEDILTSEEIVHLINTEVPFSEANSLMYKQVFPYEYVPETTQDGYTYVCIEVDIEKSFNKTYLEPMVYVYIFTHRSQLRLPEGGVRVDKLASAICEIINGDRYFGLGQLDFYSSKRFAPMTDYQGKVLRFTAVDFNRQYNPKQPIPSNRKFNL